jgi:Domain of unknown function (DUF4276)
LKSLTIHLEGGSEKGHKEDLAEIREAFRVFLGVTTNVRIVAWGPRRRAYEKFSEALEDEPERDHLLLVDSEAPLQEGQPRWLHVLNREGDGWTKPKNATEAQLHFMAQCVESWLVADAEKLGEFYGPKLGSLPQTRKVEEIPKVELMTKLKQATWLTPRGEYHKTQHFPALFKRLRRHVVRDRADHCKTLLERLKALGVTTD